MKFERYEEAESLNSDRSSTYCSSYNLITRTLFYARAMIRRRAETNRDIKMFTMLHQDQYTSNDNRNVVHRAK